MARPYEQTGGGSPLLVVESILADKDSALRLAHLVKARWGDDTAWDSPTVIVPAHLLSEAEYAALVALVPGDELVTATVPVGPAVVPAADGRWRIEGWVETWDSAGEHTIQFAVSDSHRWRADAGLPVIVSVTGPGTTEFGSRRSVSITVTPAGGTVVRPMDSWVTVYVDGERVGAGWWAGGTTPITVGLSAQTPPGAHIIRAAYQGVWGFWAEGSAEVPWTVTPAPVTAVLSATPTGPVGATSSLRLRLTTAGTAQLPGVPAVLESAEPAAPDEWVQVAEIPTAWGQGSLEWPITRPLLLRAVWSGQGYQQAVSNTVAVGLSWSLVAEQHPTWADVAAARADWADVAARG